MEKLVRIENALTEKGNLKNQVRADIKDQAVEAILDGFELTDKGQYVKAIATVDGNGIEKTAYVAINLSISVSETLFDAPKAKEASEDAEVEATDIPVLF